jgi:PAS domain S-box-containing protein
VNQLGFTQDEITSDPSLFESRIHPEDLEKFQQARKGLLESKKSSITYRFQHKNGNYKWLKDIAQIIKDPQSDRFLFIGSLTEIESEIQNQKQHELLYSALESLSSVIRTDVLGYIVYANQNAAQYSGYSVSELLGQPLSILYSGTESEIVTSDRWSLLFAAQAWIGEICRKNRNQEFYWVQSFVIPVLDSEERVSEILYIEIEKSAEKNLEKERIEALQLSSLAKMASGMAHEINNPLAIIGGKTDQMIAQLSAPAPQSLDTQKILQSLSRIKEMGKRIAHVVRSLRGFSESSLEDNFTICTVQSLIEDVMILCQSRMVAESFEIETPKEINLNLSLACQSVLIKQILYNLISNSFDASENSSTKKIVLQVEDLRDKIKFLVEDHGSGFEEKDLTKLFHPFFTTKPPGKGTGLALSSAKGIVEKHHGSIFLESPRNPTRFAIYLPKKQPTSLASAA